MCSHNCGSDFFLAAILIGSSSADLLSAEGIWAISSRSASECAELAIISFEHLEHSGSWLLRHFPRDVPTAAHSSSSLRQMQHEGSFFGREKSI